MRTDLLLNAKVWLDWVSILTQELETLPKQTALKVVFDTLADQLRMPEPLQPKQSKAILEILSELQESPELDFSWGKTLRDLADEGRVEAQLRDDIGTVPGAVSWISLRFSSLQLGVQEIPVPK